MKQIRDRQVKSSKLKQDVGENRSTHLVAESGNRSINEIDIEARLSGQNKMIARVTEELATFCIEESLADDKNTTQPKDSAQDLVKFEFASGNRIVNARKYSEEPNLFNPSTRGQIEVQNILTQSAQRLNGNITAAHSNQLIYGPIDH